MMKYFSILLFFFGGSSYLAAQEIPLKIFPEKKKDSLTTSDLKNNFFPDSLQKISSNKLGGMIALPNAFPKNSDVYLALKGKARNDKQYKILNAVPETEKLNLKLGTTVDN